MSKIITYNFKPEFEKKLGTDKEEFIKNLKMQGKFTLTNCERLDKLRTFELFIIVGITWRISPEQQKYWKKVSKR